KRKVDLGDIDPPELQDNLRAIAKRAAKLIDLKRKVEQSAVKLSLYYRTLQGEPLAPRFDQLHDFPAPASIDDEQLSRDIALALAQRPELAVLDALQQRVRVDLAEARNDLLPNVDAMVYGSQDMGAPTSSKRDKSPFELEAGVFVDVPLQRRKAHGKIQATQGKLIQLAAKRQYTEDKIRVELQAAYAALVAAYNRLDKARESVRLAEYMADVERRKLEVGESNLLSVALREQYAIEAAEAEVEALLDYFFSRADYDAAMARDWPAELTAPE
ncbi:MAG: TolC family protein, partial [Planctomycetales bacterium]|nr:TolC family protein [Planctomycetales bacterium]